MIYPTKTTTTTRFITTGFTTKPTTQATATRTTTRTTTVPTTIRTTTRATITTRATTASGQFDINYWVSYAKSYAQSVGLKLDSTAVYCYDSPITAGPNSPYTERDIRDCMNHYASDSRVTSVWVWYKKQSSTLWHIYVGYA